MNVTEVGVVGMLVLMILKEVFAFIKARSGNGAEAEDRHMMKRLVDLNERQTDSLSTMSTEMTVLNGKFEFMKELLRNISERVR